MCYKGRHLLEIVVLYFINENKFQEEMVQVLTARLATKNKNLVPSVHRCLSTPPHSPKQKKTRIGEQITISRENENGA